MEISPSRIGARAEMEGATALTRAGKRVYAPFFGADSRVDLVYEDDGGFHRVQCKTSRLIGVYSPDLDEVPPRAGHLRPGPARNGQAKGVRWARDYRLAAS